MRRPSSDISNRAPASHSENCIGQPRSRFAPDFPPCAAHSDENASDSMNLHRHQSHVLQHIRACCNLAPLFGIEIHRAQAMELHRPWRRNNAPARNTNTVRSACETARTHSNPHHESKAHTNARGCRLQSLVSKREHNLTLSGRREHLHRRHRQRLGRCCSAPSVNQASRRTTLCAPPPPASGDTGASLKSPIGP